MSNKNHDNTKIYCYYSIKLFIYLHFDLHNGKLQSAWLHNEQTNTEKPTVTS
jgi:hypothetical protein